MQRIPAGVAAGHPDTARVGAQTLERGGTAADAAAAMILAGCVAETIFSGLAGGGFATVYEAATRTVTCLDFFVSVPGLDGSIADAPRTIDIAFGSVPMPYALGGPTVATPGTPRGVSELHRRFGRLPWADVVGPARDLARSGVEFSAAHADLLPDIAAAMVIGAGADSYARPAAGAAYRLLQAGEALLHPGLADALEEYLQSGPDALMTGRYGVDLVAAVRADGGALSMQDMQEYRVADLPATSVPFGPGNIRVRGNDLDQFARTAAVLDPAALRGDPLRRARDLISVLRAPARRSETTSVAAVDEMGNACAATHSLGLGSGIWSSGIHANSMLGEGELLRGDLVPGGRMPSMMVPLVVTDDDGKLLVAGGAAGGSRIRPALLQVLTNVLILGQGAGEAVRAPRLSATESAVHLEPGFPQEVYDGLAADGEVIVRWDRPQPYFGGVAMISADGPAADPRRGGLALHVR